MDILKNVEYIHGIQYGSCFGSFGYKMAKIVNRQMRQSAKDAKQTINIDIAGLSRAWAK